MRRAYVATVSLLLVLAMAGGSAALTNDDSHENDGPQERSPYCMEDSPAIGVDPFFLLGGGGNPIVEIPLHIFFQNETLVQVCSGEHWDSQNPTTKRSDGDTAASEEEDTNGYEGTLVYVNPLGDCSHWDSDTDRADASQDEGCSGGTDRPTGPEDGDVLHLSAMAHVPTDTDHDLVFTFYVNEETWGVGQSIVVVEVNTDKRAGYVTWYGEDHSDQIFNDIAGDPLDHAQGNYVTIPFDPVQQGEAHEGDCTQFDYVHTQEDGHTEDRDGHNHQERNCRRDNTAVSVEFGYNWLPFAGVSGADTGQTLLP